MTTAVSTSKTKTGTASEAAQPGTVSWPLVLVSTLGGLMVAAAVGLWAYFGSTVFFEMVRAGWIACF